MDFRQFYPRQKPHYTRLFAFETLKNPHFSGTGSNRRFFGSWEEKWIDWEEKMIEGNTPKNGLHTDKIMSEVQRMNNIRERVIETVYSEVVFV